jgi:hypothetical protein
MSDRIIKQSKRRREQADDILTLPGFEQDIAGFRKKFGIPIGGIKKPEMPNTWRAKLSDQERLEFDRDIDNLLAKYHLTSSWHDAVKAYILLNQLVGGWLTPRVGHSFDKDDNIIDLHINLEKDTALKDVEEVWPMVEIIQENMPGRFDKNYRPKKPETKERDEKVMKLSAQGKTHKEIAKELGMSYPDVMTIIRNNKKRQSKR